MQTKLWDATDTEERFNRHYKMFPKIFQPYKDRPLTYVFNEEGFRMTFELEPDKTKKVDIYLGCSHTYGAGQYWENTWPYQVAQFTGNEIVNLGRPGAGPEGSFFRLLQFFDYFDVQNVFYFQDIVARFDYFGKEKVLYPFSPVWEFGDSDHPYKNEYLEKILIQDWYIYYNYYKYILAMKGICSKNNVPFFNICEFPHDSTRYYAAIRQNHFDLISIEQEWIDSYDERRLVSRDGTHSPALTLKVVADKFIKYKKQNPEGFIPPYPYMEKIFQKISP